MAESFSDFPLALKPCGAGLENRGESRLCHLWLFSQIDAISAKIISGFTEFLLRPANA
jgi:hypothetical protein